MRQHIEKFQEMFTLRNIFNFVMMFLSSGVIFVAMIYGFIGADSEEQKNTCLTYQQYSREFEHFWISAESKVMCNKFGIEIDAEVH